MEEARSRGMTTIGLTGQSGGKLNACSDIMLRVPSQDTPRIQECHILIGHILCQIIEEEIFPKR
jgi:D-sedoheptulose 7-phosphate isomerase